MLGLNNAKFTAAVDALRLNNMQQFCSLVKHVQSNYEARKTDCDAQIYNGFYLIHYACLFKREKALEMLLPTQCEVGTRHEILIPAPGISSNTKITLAERSSALYVCLLADFVHGAKMLMSFLSGRGKAFGNVNFCNQTILHYAALHRNETATYLLYERALLDLWDVRDDFPEHFTFAAVLAFAGRGDVFSCMLQMLYSGISVFADRIAAAMLFVDEDGCNMVYICAKPIEDIEKYQATEESRARCQYVVKRALVAACKYIKQRCNAELSALLEFWMGDTKLRHQLAGYIKDTRVRKVSRLQLIDQLIDSSLDSSFSQY